MAIYETGGMKYPSEQWYSENVLAKGKEAQSGREVPISSNRVIPDTTEERSASDLFAPQEGNVSGLNAGQSPYQVFGNQLMNMLTKYQRLSNLPYEQAISALEKEKAKKGYESLPSNIQGMQFSPDQIMQYRQSGQAPIEAGIEDVTRRNKTFLAQIEGFGNALEQARALGNYMWNIENERTSADRDMAMDILTNTNLLQAAQKNEETMKWMGKALGVKADFLKSITPKAEKPDIFGSGEGGYYEQYQNPTTGQWETRPVSGTGGGNEVTSFDDVLQSAINDGASPEEAARAAQLIAENQGLQLTLKDVEKLKARANVMSKSNQGIPSTTSIFTPSPGTEKSYGVGKSIRGVFKNPSAGIRGRALPQVGSFFKGLFGE